ncbi:hypothetical protein FACS1894132_05980 [Clostridia bacterium]|nr:hypothetical protein FACS1894132_05980 [Clostridia bacterium]
MGNGYNLLDSKAFDDVFEDIKIIEETYTNISVKYDDMIKHLITDGNWKGKGADAFKKDAANVRANLTEIYEMLKAFGDTVHGCYDTIKESDTRIGKYNENPFQN